MLTLLTLAAILQSFSISLGVGSSTIAICSFFVAIADGTIEPSERKMMGVNYFVLRVAMVFILLTTLTLLVSQYFLVISQVFTPYVVAQLIVLAVLFINAILMTAHIMPSTFGPAIQEGNWYTLGLLAALLPLKLVDFTILQFILGYFAWLVLAISIVNGVMAVLKQRRKAA